MKDTARLYKLIIVDDETMIRTGLADVVDWSALGFQLVGVFEDGGRAIAYLTENPVDAVLTDIRMNQVSGLELARHIQKSSPQVAVVILTGYKEFEYAREAVTLNVFDFLLKPTNLTKIQEVFTALKRKLDQARQQEFSADETLKLARMVFFQEIVAGAAISADRIVEWTSILKLDYLLEFPCCELALHFIGATPPLKAMNIDGFLSHQSIRFFRIPSQTDEPRYLATSIHVQSKERFHKTLGDVAVSIQTAVTGAFNLSLDIRLGPCYEDLLAYSEGKGRTGKEPAVEETNDYHRRIIGRAKDFIRHNFHRDLALEDVANHVFLSPAYFSACFKRWTGKTFIEFLTENRINAAKTALGSKKTKIGDVATAVGYSSSKYFARIFKKHTGSTPREYAKEHLYRSSGES